MLNYSKNVKAQCLNIINSFLAVKGLIQVKTYFISTNDKIVIQIYYYKTNKNDQSKIYVTSLLNALTLLINRPITLRLIRLNHVSLDSSLLAQTISSNTDNYNFNRIIKIIKSKLPLLSNNQISDNLSGLTGIKVKLAGRLTTQRSIPRQTTQTSRIGNKYKNSITDYSKFTSKNKLGSFTIKV